MKFLHPQAFALLALLPLYFWLARRRPRTIRGMPLPGFAFLKQLKPPPSWKLYLPPATLALGLALAITALARPQFGQEVIKTQQKGIDILLALDISGSMFAEDFPPNRLEAAKAVLVEFIRAQQGNRLGIVIFSGRSFTLMPLSTDYHLLMQSVQEVHADMIATDGTAIGDAISNAVYRFKDDNTKSRAIILLTDGENNAGHIRPLVAAQIAAQKKIRIYTIGVGRVAGVPIPLLNPRTGRKEYLRNPDGSLVMTRINEGDLTEIARLTGGLYFQADNQEKLTAIYHQIAQMEKAEFEVKKRTLFSEKMHFFLLPALILCLLSFALSRTVARVVRVG